MSRLLTQIEMERKALRAIEMAKNGQPLEDSTIEVKREWIDPVKAARRLAGHANAARGEPIIWIIGFDERARRVVNAGVVEMANWWSGVERCFESVIPAMREHIIAYPEPGETVVVMQFETSRAPYLVKNSQGGGIDYEVPWREGTKTRTARRSDLIQMLEPVANVPEVEILYGYLNSKGPRDDPSAQQRWMALLRLYLVSQTERRVVVPFHNCWFQVELSPGARFQFANFALDVPHNSKTIVQSGGELLIDGPGTVDINAWCDAGPFYLSSDMTPRIDGVLVFAPGNGRQSIAASFQIVEMTEGHSRWRLVD